MKITVFNGVDSQRDDQLSKKYDAELINELSKKYEEEHRPELGSVIKRNHWDSYSDLCYVCGKKSRFGKKHTFVIGKMTDRQTSPGLGDVTRIDYSYTTLHQFEVKMCFWCDHYHLYKKIVDQFKTKGNFVPERGVSISLEMLPKGADFITDITNHHVIYPSTQDEWMRMARENSEINPSQ